MLLLNKRQLEAEGKNCPIPQNAPRKGMIFFLETYIIFPRIIPNEQKMSLLESGPSKVCHTKSY